MCPFLGFRGKNLYQMLASVILIYNDVLTNAKVTYVPLPGKYITPNILLNDEPLETCLNKTEYPDFVACFLLFSPSRNTCCFFVDPSCDNPAVPFLLKDHTKDDTAVYVRVTQTSSSAVDPTSQSLSVTPTITDFMSTFVTPVTSNVGPSTATVSTSVGTTSSLQTTSDLTPTSTTGGEALANSTSSHITPTPTGRVSQSTFESTPSVLMTSLSETLPTSGLISYTYDTVSDATAQSTEISAGFSSFTNNVVSMSIEMTSSESLCPCKCQQTPLTGQELGKSIASLRNELSVNKSTLSRTIRSKTSAPDDRPSATGIGMTGVVILVACLVLLIVSDLQHLCRHLKIMKQNLTSWVKQESDN